jgi:D-tyrosyl-tRNA(Tyr) deacylase
MRAVVQRVERASVTVHAEDPPSAEILGSIDAGLCVLIGVTHDDTEAIADKLAAKLWNLRIFEDDHGVMNRSLADLDRSIESPTSAAVLVVSQFTLYGDTSRGRRPSWIAAARPEQAEPLVDRVVVALEALGAQVATGRFRTDMRVELVNDGPVTVIIDL